jgi:hypothetical protein
VEVPLPWERQLWSGRPATLLVPFWRRRERYVLTDLRLVCLRRGGRSEELALHDIGDVRQRESRFERRLGLSTIVVHARDRRPPALTLRAVRRGPQVAAALELLSGDPRARVDLRALGAALEWEPPSDSSPVPGAFAGLAAAAVVLIALMVGMHGRAAAIAYPPDDAIYPRGVKRDTASIVRFMEDEVMPWARGAIGPLKGGPGRITCETCHGADPRARSWRMPAVAALPQADVRERGWELWGGAMDAQLRNAIYGYIAESDKQDKAAYMREIVMPGMARLLHRPPYDFTRSYEYNRARLAFGCYHCHRVK